MLRGGLCRTLAALFPAQRVRAGRHYVGLPLGNMAHVQHLFCVRARRTALAFQAAASRAPLAHAKPSSFPFDFQFWTTFRCSGALLVVVLVLYCQSVRRPFCVSEREPESKRERRPGNKRKKLARPPELELGTRTPLRSMKDANLWPEKRATIRSAL